MPKFYDDGEIQKSKRYDNEGRSDGQPVYIGFAEKGSAENEVEWTIHKFSYDGNGFSTERKVGFGKWSGRVGLSYG